MEEEKKKKKSKKEVENKYKRDGCLSRARCHGNEPGCQSASPMTSTGHGIPAWMALK